MKFSDTDIRARHDFMFQIEPFNGSHIQPASYELTLGPDLLLRTEDGTHLKRDCSNGFELSKGDFVLGSSQEVVMLGPQVAAEVWGKSSLGRQGLGIHVTAGWVDPGFRGQITFEIFSVSPSPIYLEKGMKIGQMAFEQLMSPATMTYGDPLLGSHYDNQRGPTPAWWEDQC